MQIENLDALIEYCKTNNRVCPQPQLWNELWNRLMDKKQIENQWQPSLPLILAAWWVTPNISKQIRFYEHLEWANSKKQIPEIAIFLTNLKEEQWFHGND